MNKVVELGLLAALAGEAVVADQMVRFKELCDEYQAILSRTPSVDHSLQPELADVAQARTDRDSFHGQWSNSDGSGFRVRITGELLAVPSALRKIPEGCGTVRVLVNSSGGDVGAALATIDLLSGRDCSVICKHAVSAAALLVACFPGRRQMMADARIGFHGVQIVMIGGAEALLCAAANAERIHSDWAGRLCARTGMSKETASTLIEEGRTRYFGAQEALKLGLIDEILAAQPLRESGANDLG